MLWKTSHTSLSSNLPTGCDRIVGAKFVLDSHEPLFILAVYFPSSNHSLDEFRETLDLPWALYEYYCDQGITLVLEDFNGSLGYLGGDRISSEPNARGELINEFLNYFNLFAVNLDNICTGPLDTFYSDDGLSSSAIDLIAVPRSLSQYINWAYVFEKDCENYSDHLPIALSIKLSVLQHCDTDGPISKTKRVPWHKLSPNQISSLYTLPLAEKLKDFNCDMEMETCFQNLSKIIWDTSEANLQVSYSNRNSHKSKSYFQLFNDIQTIKNDLNSLHRMWKDSGFDKQSTTLVDFKAKCNKYRSAIRKFIQCKENSKIVDLCKASEVDEKLFWKLLKKGKGKGKTTCILVDGKFINTDLDITNMWADFFETLGQPTTDDSYDENFRIKVESAVEQIFAECVSTLSCTEPLFVYDTMKEVCQGLKCGVAGGPDMITYEHLRYGGPVLCDILSKLYLSLFISCSVPSQFRTFLIPPLFKGKGAKACDRDSYRGIAMFSVFAKFLRWSSLGS